VRLGDFFEKGDFLEKLEALEERVVVEEVVVVERRDARLDWDFRASKRGITMITCWQMSSEPRNLIGYVSCGGSKRKRRMDIIVI
jgi:hypothetical protein